jgi:hypothetical protein
VTESARASWPIAAALAAAIGVSYQRGSAAVRGSDQRTAGAPRDRAAIDRAWLRSAAGMRRPFHGEKLQ